MSGRMSGPLFCRAVLLAAVLWSPLAGAVTRAQVLSRLSYVDGPAPTREEWLRFGDGVEMELAKIASDGSQVQAVRIRAVDALSKLGGPVARQSLEGLLAERDLLPGLTAAAGLAYARAFRATLPNDVLKRLKGLLGHEDWLVRRAAVRALAEWKTPMALEALREHSAIETNPTVRENLESALGTSRAP